MRYTYDGFIDRAELQRCTPVYDKDGKEIRDARVAAYHRRMENLSTVGVWRRSPQPWKRNDGSYIDPDYYIVDW